MIVMLKKLLVDLIYVFPKLNLFKTVYVNFKLLPFSQARRFPIFIYHNVRLLGLSGKVILNCEPKRGMLQFGHSLEYVKVENGKGQFTINGTLVINGYDNVKSKSVKLIITKDGTLEIGSNSYWGTNVKVIVTNKVYLGNFFRMPFESQLLDTNFHFVIDVSTRKVESLAAKSIYIGDYVWIANRSSIMGGTVLPSKCMITSNSLINKNFSELDDYAIIGGIPAKFIKYGKIRVYNAETEHFLLNYFKTHNERSIILPEEFSII